MRVWAGPFPLQTVRPISRTHRPAVGVRPHHCRPRGLSPMIVTVAVGHLPACGSGARISKFAAAPFLPVAYGAPSRHSIWQPSHSYPTIVSARRIPCRCRPGYESASRTCSRRRKPSFEALSELFKTIAHPRGPILIVTNGEDSLQCFNSSERYCKSLFAAYSSVCPFFPPIPRLKFPLFRIGWTARPAVLDFVSAVIQIDAVATSIVGRLIGNRFWPSRALARNIKSKACVSKGAE